MFCLTGWDAAFRTPGGSAANVMRGLASLASEGKRMVNFLGQVGDDEAGRWVPV